MNGNKMTPRTIVAGSMSQSSRIRELKRASSSGKAISGSMATSLQLMCCVSSSRAQKLSVEMLCQEVQQI
jgi:hypothetical protein